MMVEADKVEFSLALNIKGLGYQKNMNVVKVAPAETKTWESGTTAELSKAD
jgi:hypothetical protein